MSAERQLNPTPFSQEQIEWLAFAIIQKIGIQTMNGIEIPVTKEEVASYLKCDTRNVDKLVEAGVIVAHRLVNGGHPRFFLSEICAKLKRQ